PGLCRSDGVGGAGGGRARPAHRGAPGAGEGAVGRRPEPDLRRVRLADAASRHGAGAPLRPVAAAGTTTVEQPLAASPSRAAGATPVAAAVLEWATAVGFRTVLVESRAERLRGSLWDADAVLDRVDALEGAIAGDEIYAVLTDHDAPDVVDLCALLLRREPRYLGLMGSRRHTSHHLEAPRAGGASEAEVASIRTPVGLDLGGRTAAEIALSIVAGLVAVRRGGGGAWKDTV